MHQTLHQTKYNTTTGTLPHKTSHTSYYYPSLPSQGQMAYLIVGIFMLQSLLVVPSMTP